MAKIYVCSPYSGDIERNIGYARELCRKVVLQGDIPIAPHLYFTQFLDDTSAKERELGMAIGLDLLEQCDGIIVGCKYGISKGMAKEIEYMGKLVDKNGCKARYHR